MAVSGTDLYQNSPVDKANAYSTSSAVAYSQTSVLTKMDGLARVVVSSVDLIAPTILSLDPWERLEATVIDQRKAASD